MSRRRRVLIYLLASTVVVLFILGLYSDGVVPYTSSESCVSCHTDEEVIATEYTPSDPGEGGG